MKRTIDIFSIPGTQAGDIIKAFRKNFVISQDDMARACGISQSKLSDIENSRREIDPRVAIKIAAFLNIHPSILLYPDGYESLPEYKEVQKKRKKLT